MKDETAARRRNIHETLSRIAQQGGIPARRVDVPWLVETVEALEEAGISVEQALVLGAYLVGSARGAVTQQAATN